ncbi:MAG: adaptor protein MecA [Clostridia bacterium]|nr:adaptor protein MecA [Clostridia bacterium]
MLIGESKIKIVLTREETEHYGLDGSTADVSGPGARRIFWRILDRARAEVGFDPCGDKVLIQLYPLKGGGGEIFVTKLGILSESSARLVSKSDRIAMLSKKKSLYAFDTLEDIILASRAIMAISDKLSPQSDVYTEGDRYFLSIEEYGKGGEPIEFPCILEFGTALTADISTYISEHATRLTEGDGVERFSKL